MSNTGNQDPKVTQPAGSQRGTSSFRVNRVDTSRDKTAGKKGDGEAATAIPGTGTTAAGAGAGVVTGVGASAGAEAGRGAGAGVAGTMGLGSDVVRRFGGVQTVVN